jgi:hypothetical protein
MTTNETPTPIALADIVWDPQPYCNATLKPAFWKHTALGVGRVCNTRVHQDFPCPNAKQHA